jgi:hypothetical protein
MERDHEFQWRTNNLKFIGRKTWVGWIEEYWADKDIKSIDGFETNIPNKI